MTRLLKPADVVWLLLMAITCVSTWGLGRDRVAANLAATVILLLAAFKVRLVLLYFMELRSAPWAWRLSFEAWVVAVTIAILGCYWAGPLPL